MGRKICWGLLLILLVSVVIISLGAGADQPKKGGTLIMGVIGDAETINPVLAATGTARDYANMIYESLVGVDLETMEPMIGPLTERIESSDDSLTWRFYLKKGVLFSDGQELTTEDVKYTFEALADPDTNSVKRYLMDSVENIEIIDKYTIEFKLKYPSPDFLITTMTDVGILPAHLYRGTDINTNPHNHKPIGTGPFVLTEWVKDSHIIFTARKDYHRGKVHLDRVIYKVVANSNALLMAAEAGDVDFAIVPPTEVSRMQKEGSNKGLELYARWDFGYSYIGFNLEKEIFQDVRVRKALALAIDKDVIVRVAYFDQGTPASSNIVPGINWAYNPNIIANEYNVEEARRLLDEAGWKVGRDGIREKDGQKLRFNLQTNRGSTVREKNAQLVQAFWKQVGVDAIIDTTPWATFWGETVMGKDYDAIVLSWSGMGPDPDDYSLFHSSQIDGGYNTGSYRNPEVDHLLEEGRSIMDIEKRQPIYYRIQELIHADYPYIFLVNTKGNAVFNNKVRGVNPSPLGYIHDWTDIWIAQ